MSGTLEDAVQFLVEFRRLVEKHGFTITSCGCCPPGLGHTDDGNGVDTDHGEMAQDVHHLFHRDEENSNGGPQWWMKNKDRLAKERAAHLARCVQLVEGAR